MALKYFTNAYKEMPSDSIAINPEYVVSAFEGDYESEKSKKKVRCTLLYMQTGITYYVEEPYLEVIARLNEKD